MKLDFYRTTDDDCVNGRKFWFEIYVRDIKVSEPNECKITLQTKPYGRFWIRQKRIQTVKVSLVNHG